MTVNELIKELYKFPPDYVVMRHELSTGSLWETDEYLPITEIRKIYVGKRSGKSHNRPRKGRINVIEIW